MLPTSLHPYIGRLVHPAQSGGDGGGSGGSGADSEGGSGDAAQATSGLTGGDWIQAGIIVGAAVVLGLLVSYVVRKLVARRNEMIATLIGRTTGTLVFVIGFVYGLNSIGVAVGPLVGGLGVGGLAVAFALKSILHNLLAGVLIQIRQPFQIGDLVKLDGYFGKVEEISLRTVDMETVDGEYVMIPAGTVIDNAIENWSTTGQRREEVVIGIDYDADIDEVAAGIAEAVRSLDVILDKEVKVVVHALGASSVDLRILAWHDIDDHFLDVTHAIAVAAKQWCDEHGIGMPSPIRELEFRKPEQLEAVAGHRSSSEAERDDRRNTNSNDERQPVSSSPGA